jgi:signal transduction histidine kinase
MEKLKSIVAAIVRPVSGDEDTSRNEFILNVLLSVIIGLSSIAFVIDLFKKFIQGDNIISLGITFFALCFFLFLYFLSHRGLWRVVSYGLLSIFFLLVTSQIYSWGADLPSALLSYVLIIVMAGVLIDTRFAFITTIVISITIVSIGFLQIKDRIILHAYWKEEQVLPEDFIIFVVIFLIIATVSWLSNREIERSLRRARKSEAELKKERDSLEITVEEKTKELKEAQADKMAQLYRFAEFGRLSSGLFHDLVNPLSAVVLNMEKVRTDGMGKILETKAYVEKAVLATKKMEDLVSGVRKQLSREENDTLFSVSDEIRQVIQVISHRLISSHVRVEYKPEEDVTLFGDATKFHYAILNLVSNAIDAYRGLKGSPKSKDHLVLISLIKDMDSISISIQDWGTGIHPDNLQKIFEAFFTTKLYDQGIGIGLSMTKRIIEKNFNGTVSVESKEGRGSVFTIKIPST